MRLKHFLLSIIVFICFSAKAQRILTLEEAIATTLQNNYDIRLSRNDSLVAALNFSYAYAAFLPRLNGNAGLTWNINDQSQKFADGTDRQRNGVKASNISYGIALNWT